MKIIQPGSNWSHRLWASPFSLPLGRCRQHDVKSGGAAGHAPSCRLDLTACVVGLLPVARHPPPPPQPSPADLAAASGHAREVMERELKPGSASSRDSWTDVNGTTFCPFCSLTFTGICFGVDDKYFWGLCGPSHFQRRRYPLLPRKTDEIPPSSTGKKETTHEDLLRSLQTPLLLKMD